MVKSETIRANVQNTAVDIVQSTLQPIRLDELVVIALPFECNVFGFDTSCTVTKVATKQCFIPPQGGPSGGVDFQVSTPLHGV
ncbi:hypothetical protein EYF80_048112 [Liparis tanakae]|uniref:Uncharacterized protein n=1 Tax=Liparis tanakae TaxID=230148 RepID=A0A4Z2FLT9_9TELE|nr:hypothetical protein EYF80_048112 [Liparis tanakae]